MKHSVMGVVNMILNLGGESAMLDDIVHETASVNASNINNGGLASQVEYLLESGIPIESILAEFM